MNNEGPNTKYKKPSEKGNGNSKITRRAMETTTDYVSGDIPSSSGHKFSDTTQNQSEKEQSE